MELGGGAIATRFFMLVPLVVGFGFMFEGPAEPDPEAGGGGAGWIGALEVGSARPDILVYCRVDRSDLISQISRYGPVGIGILRRSRRSQSM